jgi:hypothetical protein
MRQLLTESGFNEIHYRPHPDTEHDHIRGIYLAFRDVESMTSLSFDRAGRWRDLNRQPSTISYGEHVATSLPTIPICEAEGHYCYGDGVSGWLTVLAFETDLRVSGCAPFSISLTNDGIRVWPSVRLVLRWTVKEPDGGELILSDRIAAELSLLAPGKSQMLETSVPLPVNSVRDGYCLSPHGRRWHLLAAQGSAGSRVDTFPGRVLKMCPRISTTKRCIGPLICNRMVDPGRSCDTSRIRKPRPRPVRVWSRWGWAPTRECLILVAGPGG